MIYLDYNATTPIHPEIQKKIPEWLEEFANPSSSYASARSNSNRIEESRLSILKLFGLDTYRLVFTSSATESNRLAFQFLFSGMNSRKKILLSSIEHPSIYYLQKELRKSDYEVLLIPVRSDGVVDLDFIRDYADETAMISVMLANNETGVIQPAKEIADIAQNSGVYFHCDSAQAPGKTIVNYNAIGADSFTFSGHKMYAPKGISILIYRTNPHPIFCGGGQEKGIRAGTENTTGIFSLASSAKYIHEFKTELIEKTNGFKEKIECELLKFSFTIVGRDATRLSNTTCVILHELESEWLVTEFDKRGICISRGSACQSGSWEPSYVLTNMGIQKDDALSAIRISTGMKTSIRDIDSFLSALNEIVSYKGTLLRKNAI